MILFVAPYDGNNPESTDFIAASKKIKYIISMLLERGEKVVLLNSIPSPINNLKLRYKKIIFDEIYDLNVVTIGTLLNTKIGYLINLLRIKLILNELSNKFGIPDIVWGYNAYAFELNVCSFYKTKYNSRIIIELEDGIFSRGRGFNPKPIIDWLFWQLTCSNIDFGLAVNSNLANILAYKKIPSFLLPGVLNESIFNLLELSPPFKKNFTQINVGYFGGLSNEKGAGLILKLVEYAAALSAPICFNVTGRGELHSIFLNYALKYNDNLNYLGQVTDDNLIKTIAKCDIILNLHEINFEIFPFKVLEGVSSGRLFISTDLALDGSLGRLKDAILFCERDVEAVYLKIIDGYNNYLIKKFFINKAVQISREIYSKKSISNLLTKVFKILKY